MVIVSRENVKIRGKVYQDIKTYKSGKPLGAVTNAEKEKADRLDEFIGEEIRKLKGVITRRGLLKFKERKGALKLWHQVGKALQFVDNKKIISPEDRRLVWDTIWYHVEKEFPELPPKKHISRRGTHRDHFLQCYRVGKLSWKAVSKSVSWRDWMDFFDSKTISEDQRVLDWVFKNINKEADKLTSDSMRKFFYALKREFLGKDTTVFSEEEIEKKLNGVWEQAKLEK